MLKYVGLVFLLAVVHGQDMEPPSEEGDSAQQSQSESGLSEEGANKCVMLNEDKLVPTNLEQLNGTWYKLASSPFEVTPMLPCERLDANYIADNDTLIGTAFHYVNRYSPQLLDWTQHITQGPDGGLTVQVLSPPNIDNRYYRIISNYDQYAIIYTCIWVEGQFGGRTIWVAGRTREFNQNAFNKAVKKLTYLGVPPQEWTMNTSDNC